MIRNGKQRRRELYLLSLVLALWQFTGCQGNHSADQAASSSGNQASPAAGESGSVPALAGQPRVDSPSELCLGGERGAPVKIEIFSDYQCPRCRDFYLETIKPLLAEYTRTNQIHKIYVVYHDFPLEMHPFARRAASFALAASRVGRERWLRVVDALYTEQAQWSQDGNIEAALSKMMGPTEVIVLANLAADPSIDAAVQEAVLFGQSRNITSTPTFFITSKGTLQQRIAGSVTYPTLKDYLDRTLKQ
jgi:protein-disulfide isomerase